MAPQLNEWTIGRLLTWTTDYLASHDADSPRLDAEILLAEARGCERIELYTAYDELADDRTRTAFRELVQRRAEGMPVAYLVGRREFYSMSFRVNPDVLIPRPETEFAVVALLDAAKKHTAETGPDVIDVGTGSGVIAVCAARHLDQATILAVDVSPKALEVARANAKDHGLQDRIQFLESDLFSAVPPEQRFDFVVSNPPYVSEPEFDELPRDVRDQEPRQALVGGPTGTEIIGRLVDQAAQRLKIGGCLIFEISPMIEAAVQQKLEQANAFRDVEITKDLAGHSRIVTARRAE